jgi:hypothetical protein
MTYGSAPDFAQERIKSMNQRDFGISSWPDRFAREVRNDYCKRSRQRVS